MMRRRRRRRCDHIYIPPRIPVAQRRREAAAWVEKLRKERPNLHPIKISRRNIAKSFWGKAWCDNVETYRDWCKCLSNGRDYVCHGAVVDLQIFSGAVEALVCGSKGSPYKVRLTFKPLSPAKRKRIQEMSRGKVSSLLSLMQGKLPEELLHLLCDRKIGIFPKEKDVDMFCSCSYLGCLCKHIAAVLYGIGHRLDENPELFFTLRGIEVEELFGISTMETLTLANPAELPEGADLGAVFGISLDSLPDAQHPASEGKRPARKKTGAASHRQADPIPLQDADLLPTLLSLIGPVFATRSALARGLGVSVSSITNWQKGKDMTPRMQSLVRAFLQKQLSSPDVRNCWHRPW